MLRTKRHKGSEIQSSMQSDGRVLPNLTETLVLHQLGLLRTGELPDIAARWLAADIIDTESTRMLAGHNKQDPWALQQLLTNVAIEAGAVAPSDTSSIQAIAVDWITNRWRDDRNTRAAVDTLARLGQTYPDFDLGLFVGLDDEWNGGWGRLEPDLKTEAEKEIDYFLHGPRST